MAQYRRLYRRVEAHAAEPGVTLVEAESGSYQDLQRAHTPKYLRRAAPLGGASSGFGTTRDRRTIAV